jgi:phosphatidate cytidylyltransferase
MSSELRARLLLGPIFITLAAALLWWDFVAGSRWGILLLAMVPVCLAAREYATLLRGQAPGVQPKTMLLGAIIFTIGCFGAYLPEPWWDTEAIVIAAGLWCFGCCIAQLVHHACTNVSANVGATIFGGVYLGLGIGLLLALALKSQPDQPAWGLTFVVLAIAATKIGDICAYFGGRATGKHKMAPRISPGKTWEGFAWALAGAAGTMVAGNALVTAIQGQPILPSLWQQIVFGLVIGATGALGDLVESALKRSADAKDSGSLPGFGGVLDILDALLFTGPVATAMIWLFDRLPT